ncbi:MAG TPA: alpha-hydroxy-acid oxidizing protein [Kofleriaceae bacterium]
MSIEHGLACGRFGVADLPMPMVDVVGALARSGVTWEDFRWIRQAWTGPLVAKGVLTGDDARRAIDHGVTAGVSRSSE